MSKHRIDPASLNPKVLQRALEKAGIESLASLYSSKKSKGKEGQKQDTSSPPHDMLCEALDKAGISYTRERKHPVPGRRFRIDIAIEEKKIGIEVNGWRNHGRSLKGYQADHTRHNLITLSNWHILRFTAGDIYRDVDKCVGQIREAIKLF